MEKWLLLGIAVVLNAAANVSMKIGAKTAGPLAESASVAARLCQFLNAATVVALVLFAANVLVYRKALEGLNISVAYPVMVSVGLVLVTVAAVMLPVLRERVSAAQVIGMALIGVGVWLVARAA